jgi:hypothetical protein
LANKITVSESIEHQHMLETLLSKAIPQAWRWLSPRSQNIQISTPNTGCTSKQQGFGNGSSVVGLQAKGRPMRQPQYIHNRPVSWYLHL